MVDVQLVLPDEMKQPIERPLEGMELDGLSVGRRFELGLAPSHLALTFHATEDTWNLEFRIRNSEFRVQLVQCKFQIPNSEFQIPLVVRSFYRYEIRIASRTRAKDCRAAARARFEPSNSSSFNRSGCASIAARRARIGSR
jgi:hypothetical protein